jgi:hypothetical protein
MSLAQALLAGLVSRSISEKRLKRRRLIKLLADGDRRKPKAARRPSAVSGVR